jgi:hypothetical protein
MRTRTRGRPRRRLAILGAAAAGALLGAVPAQAACGGVEHFSPTKLRRPGRAPLAIGDSVMLGAAHQLAAAGFEVDVHGCRQMGEGLGVIAARARNGTLPNVVVVALGTNWTISTSEIRSGLRLVGPARVLGMVTPPEEGGGASSDQAVIRAAGRRWPDRVKVLDWVVYSSGHDWTWDGMHLKPEGAAAFTRLLSRAFGWPLPGLEMRFERVPGAPVSETVR